MFVSRSTENEGNDVMTDDMIIPSGDDKKVTNTKCGSPVEGKDFKRPSRGPDDHKCGAAGDDR